MYFLFLTKPYLNFSIHIPKIIYSEKIQIHVEVM